LTVQANTYIVLEYFSINGDRTKLCRINPWFHILSFPDRNARMVQES